MVLELAAPAGAGPALQRCIPHIQRVFRVRVSCSTAESSCESPNAGSSIIVNIEDGKEEDCTKAKVSMCVCERACVAGELREHDRRAATSPFKLSISLHFRVCFHFHGPN
ncbi:hypothetical protein QQF64_026788 [Cirrhinus molitorella]|uniref:N4BP1 first type I KH-domain domain-containing protein n=1 Tax=Cirrhinus molitorella TaxID=172907 RepID=A0ABR3NAJ4_9TELE